MQIAGWDVSLHGAPIINGRCDVPGAGWYLTSTCGVEQSLNASAVTHSHRWESRTIRSHGGLPLIGLRGAGGADFTAAHCGYKTISVYVFVKVEMLWLRSAFNKDNSTCPEWTNPILLEGSPNDKLEKGVPLPLTHDQMLWPEGIAAYNSQ